MAGSFNTAIFLVCTKGQIKDSISEFLTLILFLMVFNSVSGMVLKSCAEVKMKVKRAMKN